MLLRLADSIPIVGTDPQPAWPAFEKTQQGSGPYIGYITQPAHAALAGQLAVALEPSLFGPLPPEIVDIIGRHDAGWATPDLAALESAPNPAPISFLAYPPDLAVIAWRNSIRAAEERSPLAGLLTSRHFCLLAPHDGHPAHDRFREEETVRRQPAEAASPVSAEDLSRYIAALGFCDLISLLLGSGARGTVILPKAHPADPASASAATVQLTLSAPNDSPAKELSFSEPVLHNNTFLHLAVWLYSDEGLRSRSLSWTIHQT